VNVVSQCPLCIVRGKKFVAQVDTEMLTFSYNYLMLAQLQTTDKYQRDEHCCLLSNLICFLMTNSVNQCNFYARQVENVTSEIEPVQ
jgi:hypothetical protein